jgi:hypothetical protein
MSSAAKPPNYSVKRKFRYLSRKQVSSPLLAITAIFDTITGLNRYDMSKDCEGGMETLCYPVTKHIANYLSRNETREILGVDHAVPQQYSSCNMDVGYAFGAKMDLERGSVLYVTALLERGIRVLIYVGESDYICNWIGNREWSEALEWSGGDKYRAVPLGTWSIDGNEVGKYKSSGPFTFATIRGAGHMVRISYIDGRVVRNQNAHFLLCIRRLMISQKNHSRCSTVGSLERSSSRPLTDSTLLSALSSTVRASGITWSHLLFSEAPT